MFKKITGAILLLLFLAIWLVTVVLPLRFIIGPLLRNVHALSTWQFIVGNIPYLPMTIGTFPLCYWGVSKSLLMLGSLRPTTHKRLLLAGLTVLGFLYFLYVNPHAHFFYMLGAGNMWHRI